MKEQMHLAEVKHDGSGTIIIGLHLVRCNAPNYCRWCAQTIYPIPVTIDPPETTPS